MQSTGGSAWLAAMCSILLAAIEACGGENGTGSKESEKEDKSGFHLFNPTPVKLMRELSPDRPDKTESPYTVDAGHFQLEMDFATFTQDRSDGKRARAWNIAPVNIRAGLLNNVDLQFVFDSYQHVRTEDRAARRTTVQSGIGDFTTRLKINLWGNDGGKTAFGFLPFIKFPINTAHLGNNGVEGGLIFPLTIKLPAGFDLSVEAAASFLRNEESRGYHAEMINSISIGHSIAGKLSGYVEFFSSVSAERHSDWIATVDAGLGFAVTDNIQLDAGCNIGVTHAADDVNPFAGLTVRF